MKKSILLGIFVVGQASLISCSEQEAKRIDDAIDIVASRNNWAPFNAQVILESYGETLRRYNVVSMASKGGPVYTVLKSRWVCPSDNGEAVVVVISRGDIPDKVSSLRLGAQAYFALDEMYKNNKIELTKVDPLGFELKVMKITQRTNF